MHTTHLTYEAVYVFNNKSIGLVIFEMSNFHVWFWDCKIEQCFEQSQIMGNFAPEASQIVGKVANPYISDFSH